MGLYVNPSEQPKATKLFGGEDGKTDLEDAALMGKYPCLYRGGREVFQSSREKGRG